MKKTRFISIVLVLTLLTALLAGCSCKHEWTEANCKDPKTCTLCGEIEGEKTDEHKWEDATTEAPKTCSVCGATEGEKINVDSRFTTAACKDLFGTWNGTIEYDGDAMGLPDFDGTVSMNATYQFSNDGKMSVSFGLTDEAALKDTMMDMIYDQLADQGINKDAADAAFESTNNMTIAEYVDTFVTQLNASFSAMNITGVYYVADGKIYSGLRWDLEMEPIEFSMENGVLKLKDAAMGTLEFTKAEA